MRRPKGECVDFNNDLPCETVEEISTLLARGFLRKWISQNRRPTIAEHQLDSPVPESAHVTVVNAQEKDDN
jgi:hypothetical protein